ncbi:hypothetical protein [Lentzea sp. NBRC 102530]|uniref:hypothetical protein n=1 Tax=Lentzea sp. NBRC 102530 TaxID=3032201 RepID=UPI00255562FC|nr:hypothetical protein [Lentzea sp. NBRC 102530]
MGRHTMKLAIPRSVKFVEFMTPDLLGRFIGDLLAQRNDPSPVKRKVDDNFVAVRS